MLPPLDTCMHAYFCYFFFSFSLLTEFMCVDLGSWATHKSLIRRNKIELLKLEVNRWAVISLPSRSRSNKFEIFINGEHSLNFSGGNLNIILIYIAQLEKIFQPSELRDICQVFSATVVYLADLGFVLLNKTQFHADGLQLGRAML